MEWLNVFFIGKQLEPDLFEDRLWRQGIWLLLDVSLLVIEAVVERLLTKSH